MLPRDFLRGDIMDTIVPESILSKTVKCPNDFSCLRVQESGKCMRCETDRENDLFLLTAEPLSCPYRISFGKKQMCRCPTHRYIVEKNRLHKY